MFFEERLKKFSGLDLVALNIQRGRDHGLPGYNNYRDLCGLPRLETFNNSAPALSRLSLLQMAAIYRHPDDVDLFTGLMSEERLEGALVGPTLGCLPALQFKNLRRCDRFWYETADSDLRYFSLLFFSVLTPGPGSVLISWLRSDQSVCPVFSVRPRRISQSFKGPALTCLMRG